MKKDLIEIGLTIAFGLLMAWAFWEAFKLSDDRATEKAEYGQYDYR